MARTLRPQSLGQILDETFNIYRKHFVLFLTISAIPNLIVLVLQLGSSFAARSNSEPSYVLSALGGFASIFASLFATSLVTAATRLAFPISIWTHLRLQAPVSPASPIRCCAFYGRQSWWGSSSSWGAYY
jgi:hypothetical protein